MPAQTPAPQYTNRGPSEQRVETQRHDEVAKLARSFNRMANRLEDTVKEQRRLQERLTRSEKLANSFDCKPLDWESRNRAVCDVIVNCTPVGMHPNVDESPMSKTSLKPSMLVFDTVYNPESTLLIKEARERNCHTVTGVDMFEKQAELQFKLFTKQDAPQGLMREVLKRTVGPIGGER